MRKIGGNTGCVDDIVEGEVVDQRAGLEEEGQWLSDTAGSSCDDCKEQWVSACMVWEMIAMLILELRLSCMSLCLYIPALTMMATCVSAW